LQAADGLLYGTTSRGGSDGAGTLFRLNADGSSYMILYSFKTNTTDGQLHMSRSARRTTACCTGRRTLVEVSTLVQFSESVPMAQAILFFIPSLVVEKMVVARGVR